MNSTTAKRQRELIAHFVGVLNSLFGAFSLLAGISFSARVVAAVIRGLTFRVLWLSAMLGAALISVGIVYLRAPLSRLYLARVKSRRLR